eukprot:602275-Alexandrium_andersonii.AAC.1
MASEIDGSRDRSGCPSGRRSGRRSAPRPRTPTPLVDVGGAAFTVGLPHGARPAAVGHRQSAHPGDR